MFEEENNRQIQDDEKLVIEAIFGGDAKFPEQKWKVWRPLNVTIHLDPQTSHSQDTKLEKEETRKVSVDFRIQCSEEYPQKCPILDFPTVQGLSQDAANKILEIIKAKAREMIGNVMVVELCDEVRTLLAKEDNQFVGSFHDNMMKKKANEIVETDRRRRDSERREWEQVDEEREKIALKRQKNGETETGKQTNKNWTEVEHQMIGGRKIEVLTNPVKRKRPYPNCHEWMGLWENEQLLISEWTFTHTQPRNTPESKKLNFEPFLKMLDDVYSEDWKVLVDPHKKHDPNLVEYAFIHVNKVSIDPTSFHVQIFVAQKVYPIEVNGQEVVEKIAKSPSLLRRLAAQAVCGLRYLHEQQSTHGTLNLSTVWLSQKIFRISDSTATADVIKLQKLFNDITSGKEIDLNEKRDEKEKKKKDFFDLGTLLDELLIAGRTSNYSRVPSPDLAASGSEFTLSKFIMDCQSAKNIDSLITHRYLNHELSTSADEDMFTSLGGAMDRDTSRVMTDFIVIRPLGKGGFGDVILVRNSLDSMYYAVKRIPLSVEVERLNKRVKKEAKLFAKLNHPNVVRYFSAWEEDLNPHSSEDDSAEESLGSVPVPSDKLKIAARKEKNFKLKEIPIGRVDESFGDSLVSSKLKAIEREAAAAVLLKSHGFPETSEWSTSFQYVGGDDIEDGTTTSSSSSDSDEEESEQPLKRTKKSNTNSSTIQHSPGRVKTLFTQQNGMGNDELVRNPLLDLDDNNEYDGDENETEDSEPLRTEDNYSDSDIEFQRGSEYKEQVETKESVKIDVEEARNLLRSPVVPKRPQVLIIQMEYCDKGTLRQFIDDGKLLNDSASVWRIFSELLGGLKYIHNQGMIHRDIKPLNIFLSSQLSVKIGDFGLATRELYRSRMKADKSSSTADKTNSIEAMLSKEGDQKIKIIEKKSGGTEQTRDIGTQLYMAPELFNVGPATAKKPYTSKVDVYSAGVVLFEMFYRPLLPGMERISTLNALRDKIEIPLDFGGNRDVVDSTYAKKIIEKMLQRNSDDRPTVEDLLNDENLPMNKGEDVQIQKHISRVIKKRGSKLHSWMMNAQFDVEVSSAVNYCYDIETCKERFALNLESITESLRNEISSVMKPHSYELIDNHTIVPASTARAAAPVRLKPCEFLDRNGLPVAFQFDLRQNFVRFCVRNAINRFKRYSFGKVYHVDDSKCNTHPQERWECCVDSIGPLSASISLDAELMLTACQLAANSLKDSKLTLRIGNVQLVDAVFRHLKIADELRLEILNVFHCFSTSDKPQSYAEKVDLLGAHVGAKTAHTLLNNLPCEVTLLKFKESCKSLLKSRDGSVRKTTEKILTDLEKIHEIFSYAATEDISRISFIYDAQTVFRPRTFCDGLVFQITVEVTTKSTPKNVSVLAGGRYDSALVRELHPRDTGQLPRCLSGYSVHMGTLARFRKIQLSKAPSTSCSTLICSFHQDNNDLLLAEKFKLARALWAFNIPADVLHEPVSTLTELKAHCQLKSLHLLAVSNSVPEVVVTFFNDPVKEAKMTMDAAIAAICRHEKNSLPITPLLQTGSSNPLLSNDIQYEDISSVITTPLSASRSVSASLVNASVIPSNRPNSNATSANMNISFASSEKIAAKDRKRIEQQVRTHLLSEIAVFSAKSRIEVIACDVGKDLIKRIVGDLTKSSSISEITTVFDQLTRQNHGKLAKDLDALCGQIQSITKNTTASPIHQNSSQVVIIIYRHADNFYRILT